MDFRAVREALRLARERAHLTLDQAAAASGLNRATIHSLENVRRDPDLRPGLDTIEKLVTTYGLTVGSFFTGFDQPPIAPPSARSVESVRHGGAPVRAEGVNETTAALLEEVVLKAVEVIGSKLDRLSDRLAAVAEQAAGARAHPSSSRERRSVGHRKSA